MENNIILTNYFTSKQDPQKHKYKKKQKAENVGFLRDKGKWPSDSKKLISPWINTLTLLNLKGVIFFDSSISKKFTHECTNDNVSFEYYKISTGWSLNDERFLCWYNWLTKHDSIKNVFTTDLFDVIFNKNPFDLITDEYDIYTGQNQNKPIEKSSRISRRMKGRYGKILHKDKIDASAGVIGGPRDNMLKLFECMLKEFKKFNNSSNNNMIVYNKCLYDLFDSKRVLVGPPVSSKYRHYQKSGNFAIKHK